MKKTKKKKDLRFVDSLITPRGQGFSQFLTGRMLDDDKDGIPNYMDCDPNNPNRDGLSDWLRRKVAPKEERQEKPVIIKDKIFVTPKEAEENDFSSRVEVVTTSPVQVSSISRRTGGGGGISYTPTPTGGLAPTGITAPAIISPTGITRLTQAQQIQQRQEQKRIEQVRLQQQALFRRRQEEQRRFPTTKKEKGFGVPVGVDPTPSGVSPEDDMIVVYDTETGTAYLSDEPVRKKRLPKKLQKRAEEARREKKFFKGQLLSTGAFVTSFATTLARIPKDTVQFVLSPIKSTKGLIEYVKSGSMQQDIKVGMIGGGEVLAGKALAFVTAPKIYGKAIPKKVSAKFSKKAKQFKELSEAEPTVSVGIKRTKGNVQELTVATTRQTSKLESGTITKYQIEKVGENFQISKGKGTTTIKKLGKDKGKILEQEFTFTGEAQPAKVTRVKSYKKSYLDDAIVIQREGLPSGVSPVKGRIEMLTKGEKPKLTKEPFFGISKKVKGVDVSVGARIETTGFRPLSTGARGVRARTQLKGIARPKARSISFIKELPKRIEAVEPIKVTRFKPKKIDLITGEVKAPRITPRPKARPTELISKQITRPEVKPAKVISQAVERQAVRQLIKTKVKPRTLSMVGFTEAPLIQSSKQQFKSTLESENFALGQKAGLSTDLTQSTNPLFDAIQDVSVKTVVTTRQTPAQLLTPRTTQVPIVTTTPKAQPPISPAPLVPIIPKVKPKPKLVSGQGWNTLIRKQATDTAKARWEKLNTQSLTKKSALSLGAETTDKDIAATFKISKAKVEYEKIKKGDKKGKKKVKKKILDTGSTYFDDNVQKFREYKKRKGKKLVTTGRFIERRAYRLDTPSERQEIGQAPRKNTTGLFTFPGEQRPTPRTRVQARQRNPVPLIPISQIPKSRPQEFEQPQDQSGLARLGRGVNSVQNLFDRFNGAMSKTSDRIKVNISPRNRRRDTKQQPSIARRR